MNEADELRSSRRSRSPTPYRRRRSVSSDLRIDRAAGSLRLLGRRGPFLAATVGVGGVVLVCTFSAVVLALTGAYIFFLTKLPPDQAVLYAGAMLLLVLLGTKSKLSGSLYDLIRAFLRRR